MPKENQSQVFIRLLTEALEADRYIKRAIRALKHEARSDHFMQISWSEFNNAMLTLEPLGNRQRFTASKTQDLQIV